MDKGYHLGRLDLGLFSLLSMCPYHSSFIPFRTQSMLEISKLFDCKGNVCSEYRMEFKTNLFFEGGSDSLSYS